MDIYSSIWHVVVVAMILFFGFVLSASTANYFNIKLMRVACLYSWHTFFCLLYLWYSLNTPGDAIAYFDLAKSTLPEFSFGTDSIYYITGILVQVFDVSILGAFLVFNIFGVIGIVAFDAALHVASRDKPKYIKRISTIVVFLPSVSFWSSAIGKDSLSFMATGLALWAALVLNRRWMIMALSVLIMLLVRPHIAGMMVLAWSLAILFSYETTYIKRTFLALLMTITLVTIVPFALQYAGVDNIANVQDLIVYIDMRQSYNVEGAGGVDISSMSLPMQMFTYMFRPLIFESNTFLALVASVENLFLSYIFVTAAWAMMHGIKKGLGDSRVFLWTYVLLVWVVLAMTTSNLGIALRQKWMFAPMLVFLLISMIDVVKRQSLNTSNLRSDGTSPDVVVQPDSLSLR